VIDPLLGDLADNGGPTLTHSLLPGSPTINQGDLNAVAGVGGVPESDQRGGAPFSRVVGTRIDIGAVESIGNPILVDTLIDESDGDYSRFDLSLREAIELANSQPGADTIAFDPLLSGGTILLTMGFLIIDDSVDIQGLDADQLTIDASGNDPTPDSTPLDGNPNDDFDGSGIFFIDDRLAQQAFDVEFSGLTLTGGDSGVAGGAILAGSDAGEQESRSNLSLYDMVIEDNFARSGGAIYKSPNLGNVLVSSTIIRNNIAFQGSGGGIFASNRDVGQFTILSSTFTNNTARNFGGGVRLGTSIGSEPTEITILDSLFSGNRAGNGGGISANGDLTLSRTTVTGNSAVGFPRPGGYFRGGSGGGVQLTGGGIAISESTISGNSAGHAGGGLSLEGASTRIADTLISTNVAAGNGGGLSTYFGIPTEIVNTTISGNSTFGNGGGVSLYGPFFSQAPLSDSSSEMVDQPSYFASDQFVIAHSTITNNTADLDADGDGSGGGIESSNKVIKLNHTIVAGNRRAAVDEDISGDSYDIYYGLVGAVAPGVTLSGTNNLFGSDPLLAPLADNGGPTLTHALLPGSPAINAGVPALVADVDDTPEYDQRGAPFSRVVGTAIDMGAFEAPETPIESIGLLKNTVEALELRRRVERSLLRNLDRAVRKLGDGNYSNDWAAIAQLKVFAFKVKHYRGRGIDSADAELLVKAAKSIVVEIREDILRPWFDDRLFDLLARSKTERQGFLASRF